MPEKYLQLTFVYKSKIYSIVQIWRFDVYFIHQNLYGNFNFQKLLLLFKKINTN